jgi:hypothetical protein
MSVTHIHDLTLATLSVNVWRAQPPTLETIVQPPPTSLITHVLHTAALAAVCKYQYAAVGHQAVIRNGSHPVSHLVHLMPMTWAVYKLIAYVAVAQPCSWV